MVYWYDSRRDQRRSDNWHRRCRRTQKNKRSGTSESNANAVGISTCPSKQVEAWDDLSHDDKFPAKVLGYTKETWDSVYNHLEDIDFESFTPEQKWAAAALGYDTVEKWDCCIDHYYSYHWNELDERTKGAFEVLGFTKAIYDANENTDAMYLDWTDLSAKQKAAAAVLCYNQNFWQENKVLLEAQGQGQGQDQGQGQGQDSKPAPASAPAPEPEPKPVSTNVASVVSNAIGTASKYTGTNRVSMCPTEQDETWSNLSAEDKFHASVLGYTEEEWNLDNNAKYNLLEDIDLKSLTPEQRQSAADLGFDTIKKWDCCVDHYYSYHWNELDETAKAAFKVLGWTPETYDSNYPEPTAWLMYWAQLNAEQKAAAADICYTEESWDEDGRGANLPAPGAEPTFTSYDISICPPEIAEVWSDLSAEDKDFATTLGYTEETWDLYGLPTTYDQIEDTNFAHLTDDKQKAAAGLGYGTVEKWDCCVNHYNSYWWNQLDDDRKAAYKFFGWTAVTFNNNYAPEDWKKDWADLTAKQKESAAVLCFNQKSWEENEALLDPGSMRRKQRMLRLNTGLNADRTKRLNERTVPGSG